MPSVIVTTASHNPMTLVGTASVTRPFNVTFASTGGGVGAGEGATGGGSTDGAVGESSRLQPPASAAPSVTAIKRVEDTPAFDLLSASVPNPWHFTPADCAIGTPRPLSAQKDEAI